MSITYTNAQTAVARSLGNASDSDQLSAAGDAIKAAIQEWNLRQDWRFLLMDTSNGFSVAGCSGAGGQAVVTTTNSFAGVNVGQTVTGTNIPASTTVSSVDSSTQITLSQNLSGTVGATVTFSADIPVRVGVAIYNLPTPIKRPYDARLITNERTLIWKDQRELDRLFSATLSTQGIPEFWNTFNSATFSTATQNGKIQLYRTPDATDTLRVRYYRPIAEPSTGSDNLDVIDRYVYPLLELAKYYYMKDKDSDNPRTNETKERAEHLLRKAIGEDMQGTEENDLAFVPQIEHNLYRRFDPDLPFGGV